MPRQFKLLYKRAKMAEFATLSPHAHVGIYSRPEVERAVNYLKENHTIAGIAIRVDDELFNLMVFDAPTFGPQSFPLEPMPETSVIEAPPIEPLVSDVEPEDLASE